jgi:hypothetical protein
MDAVLKGILRRFRGLMRHLLRVREQAFTAYSLEQIPQWCLLFAGARLFEISKGSSRCPNQARGGVAGSVRTQRCVGP